MLKIACEAVNFAVNVLAQANPADREKDVLCAEVRSLSLEIVGFAVKGLICIVASAVREVLADRLKGSRMEKEGLLYAMSTAQVGGMIPAWSRTDNAK